MRKDMDRVIITPPRYGGGRLKKCRNLRDWDDYPSKQGMKRPHHVGWGIKSQSDFLNPLHGFLRKHAGRPWNDVWREVCRQFSSRGYVTNHVRFHTAQAVERLVLIDGKLWSQVIGGWYDHLSLWNPNSPYEQNYVDLDGILRVTKPTKRKPKRTKRLTRVSLEDGSELRLYDELWYRTVEDLVEIGPGPVSPHTGRRSPAITYNQIVVKNLLSKKLLKFYGLKNMTIQYRRAA